VSTRKVLSGLFSKGTLNQVRLKNRIGARLPDIHRSKNGVADDWLLIEAGLMIRSGIGLLCLENVAITPIGRLCSTSLGLWNESQLPQFQRYIIS
jgi:2,4-dienoyl-CoA reductase-like NADH-dependent reductase (Old Yellow Enzyme family)